MMEGIILEKFSDHAGHIDLGIKALIVKGAPPDASWWLLHLSKEGGRFESADDLVGLGVYESATRLLERFGPAGEMRLAAAGIQNLDKDCEPSRIAARGGWARCWAPSGSKPSS